MLHIIVFIFFMINFNLQSEWKTEISEQLQIIQTEGCQYPKLEEELIKRRKEELRLEIETYFLE